MLDTDAQMGGDGVIFITLDLYNGFLKIPLITKAKQKISFVIEQTTAKFERMLLECSKN